MNRYLYLLFICWPGFIFAQSRSLPFPFANLHTTANSFLSSYNKAGNGILDSSRQYKFDSLELRWKWYGSKFTYTYDAQGNTSTKVDENWNETNLVGQQRFVYSYDNQKNLLSETKQIFQTGNWQNYSQLTYAYNAQNDSTIAAFNVWIGTGWEERSRTLFSYNANVKLTEMVMETKDSGIWERTQLDSFVFDSNDRLLQQFEIRWYEGTIIQGEQILYQYDSLNRLTQAQIKQRDGILWENRLQNIFIYDSGNLKVTEVKQNWFNNAWENSIQTLYTLNTNQNITQELKQIWDGTNWVNKSRRKILFNVLNQKTMDYLSTWYNNQWNSNEERTYDYDGNGNEIHYLSKLWDVNLQQWIKNSTEDKIYDAGDNLLLRQSWVNSMPKAPIFKTLYYYRGFPSGMEDVVQADNISLYPNPAKNVLHIDAGSNSDVIQVYLINLMGQTLLAKEFTNNDAVTLDLTTLQPGIYIVEVIQGMRKMRSKLVRE